MTKVEGERLLRENAELRAQVDKLTSQIAKLTDRITELLAVAQRRQRPPPADKPAKPKPDLRGAAKRAFDARPMPSEKPARPEPEKKPRKPTGRKRLPQHLVAEEHGERSACWTREQTLL